MANIAKTLKNDIQEFREYLKNPERYQRAMEQRLMQSFKKHTEKYGIHSAEHLMQEFKTHLQSKKPADNDNHYNPVVYCTCVVPGRVINPNTKQWCRICKKRINPLP